MKLNLKNITESKETSVVYPSPISKTLMHILKVFQLFISEFEFKTLNIDEAKAIYDNLLHFKKYHFARPILGKLKRYIDEIDVTEKRLKGSSLPRADHLKAAFLQGKYKEIQDEALELRDQLLAILNGNEKLAEPFYSLRHYNKGGLEGLFSGGQRTGLFGVFNKDTISEVTSVDIDSHSFSYIHPKVNSDGSLYLGEGINELELMSYIILHLKDSPKPIRLTPSEYEIYRRITSIHFNEMRDLLQRYIFSNDKSIVNEIRERMTPEDRRAMLASIRNIRRVYRGVGVGEDDDDLSIIKQDQSIRYVSTSPSKRVAERFSRGLGHLDNPDDARSAAGAVLEYDISNRDCVILSTAIWGEAYNESDILIDVSKAKFIDIDVNYYR